MDSPFAAREKLPYIERPDLWIVGQGVAGTLLAHFLLEKGLSPLVIDEGEERAASRVAAGIMNPVTGRHFALTWMAAELFPFARQTYRHLEQMLGERFYDPYPVYRALPDVQAENDWLARSGDAELVPFIGLNPPLQTLRDTFRGAEAYVSLQGGGRCDLGKLTAAYRSHLREMGLLHEKSFDFGAIDPAAPPCPIVFCEGAKGTANPWFGTEVPFRLAKGEVLIVHLPDYPLKEAIVKNELFLVPLGNDQYWVGSNYEQRFAHDRPTEERRAAMEAILRQTLRVPFTVVDHRSALRPTTANRRPYWGQHAKYPDLYVLNGLGTKGATLGPYFAHELAQMISQQIKSPS
jgi:glycine/D-amino acid oxidase-like deaminating enzyme